MSTIAVFKRRGFLKGITGGAGLLLGCTLPEVLKLSGQDHPRTVERGPKNPNAFIHISPNNTVTFIVTKPEMGQGTATALPMLLAEELDCDWNKIQTEFAPVDPGSYGMQGVYGSSSIRQSWRPLRQIGATARAMLIEAASQKWNVDKNQIRTEDGWLIGPGNTGRLSYGSVAEAAAKLPVASEVPLKSPKNFRLIGTPIKRLDTRTKVNGSAKFGIDARVPGMQYAVLAHCPVFGGKVVSFDASMAKAIPGVKAIVQVSNGVAVVADNTWTAMEARKALAIQWDEGANSGQSSASIRKMFADLADRPGALAKKTGDSSQALACAAKKVDAVYEAPFLAHAPMEPINCTAVVRPDSSEIWAATQAPTATRESAAKITGLAPEKIKVNTLFVGGGFGRRSNVDYVADAVEIAKAVPGVPVKLTWTREDDIERGPYRPGAYVKFASGLDSDGWPTSLAARVACPSFSEDAAAIKRIP